MCHRILIAGNVFMCLSCFFTRIIHVHQPVCQFKPVLCGSRKYCQRGSKFDNVFFLFFCEGIKDPNVTINGLSSARQRNAILSDVSLAGRCWPNIEYWLGGFVIFQGIRTSISKKPFIFVISQGGPDHLSPSRSAHVSCRSRDL